MKALLQQALDALEKCTYDEEGYLLNPDNEDVIEALRAELEKEEPEPVAWRFVDDEDNNHPTYQSKPPTPEAVAYLAKWKRPAWEPLFTKEQL